MSSYVSISKRDWKNNPISKEEWKKAAQTIALHIKELSVEPVKNKNYPDNVIVYLKSNKRMNLHLDPYGVVTAQDPNEELVEIMFKLAEVMNAKVYSERAVPYKSLEDWEKRTKKYRERKGK